MADKAISELLIATQMTDDAYLAVYQSGQTRSIEGRLIKQYARDSVGAYVEGAKQSAKEAAESASTAAGSAAAAVTSAKSALAAKTAAEGARDSAINAKDTAVGAKTASEAAKAAAIAARDGAKVSETAARSAESTATQKAAEASKSALSAQESKTAAELAADRAASSTPYVSAHGTWMVWDKASNTFKDSGIRAQGPQGPQGIQGIQGIPGKTGALADLETGVFAMGISEDGHLLVSVNVNESIPPLVIDQNTGHLIYEIV